MKQKAFFLLILFLLSSLSACGAGPAKQDAIETDWTVEQMAAAVWEAGSSLKGTELLPGDEVYDAYMSGSYRIEARGIADGAIWAAGGTSAQEVAVFQLTDASQAESAAERLETYLQNRIGAFTGYLPEEVALLENALVEARGAYVALLACEDLEEAQDAFSRCFTDAPPAVETVRPWAEPPAPEEETAPSSETSQTVEEEPAPTEPKPETEETPPVSSVPISEPEPPDEPAPETEPTASSIPEIPELPKLVQTEESSAPPEATEPWSYDENRLLTAWAAGDWSGLAAEDRAILDICQEVISTVVPTEGSAYDQELAVHDWMIAHASYDSNRLSNLPDFQENPNNDNPYGFLVDDKGICLGYARTFQLFMDLLGIECLTVEGTAYGYTADHAWNQVRLDGEWYCVDVTWDDPTTSGVVSERSVHRFFNVTSQRMRDTDHQWDENTVPEATGTAYAWNP